MAGWGAGAAGGRGFDGWCYSHRLDLHRRLELRGPYPPYNWQPVRVSAGSGRLHTLIDAGKTRMGGGGLTDSTSRCAP